MYLDVKITIWERVEFNSEEEMNDVMAKFESGEFINSGDVTEYLERDAKYLDDTFEYVRKEENFGQPTQEIVNGDKETIWTN